MDKKVDYHVYPSGRQVIKAFTANDFQFIDLNGQVITGLTDASIDVVDRVRLTWRIKKMGKTSEYPRLELFTWRMPCFSDFILIPT